MRTMRQEYEDRYYDPSDTQISTTNMNQYESIEKN